MATDENNHKNEARDDWTGCTFRVERGPSSEGRAWGMADILTEDDDAEPMDVDAGAPKANKIERPAPVPRATPDSNPGTGSNEGGAGSDDEIDEEVPLTF